MAKKIAAKKYRKHKEKRVPEIFFHHREHRGHGEKIEMPSCVPVIRRNKGILLQGCVPEIFQRKVAKKQSRKGFGKSASLSFFATENTEDTEKE